MIKKVKTMQEDTSVYAFVTVTIGVCLGEKDNFDEQNLTPKQVIQIY